MKRLENKVALITGAGSGMGKAMAELFALEGARVVAADINAARLTALESSIVASGGTISTCVANMAVAEEVERMVATAVERFGNLDILVNNAGIMDHFAPAAEVEDSMWNKVMRVNVDGPFWAMRAALRIFLSNKSGVILNIASIGGLNGGRAGAAYTTSKHALIGLTKNTGYMYAKSGIRCNAIAPGAVATNIGETIDFTKITPLVNDRIMAGMALNPRTGDPMEIARVALFLVSEESSFVNATVLTVDGGWESF